MNIKTFELFAPVYNKAFKSIMNHEHERWTFTGGRASCKSSFISICIVLLIVLFPRYNALIIRRYSKSMRLSVFEQIVWAIDKLHLRRTNGKTPGFKIPKSTTAALPIKYIRKNGWQQQIIFAGLDDPEKLKSIKISSGYIAIMWIEEKTEVEPQDLQNVKISALRGGDKFYMFESYNPPSAVRHWCNTEARENDPQRLIVHTTWQDIPREWLGAAIMHDIEQTRKNRPKVYENIYLGIATGTGRQVFENVELREITDEEIASFDETLQGIDWGFYPDPYAYGSVYYDIRNNWLYVWDELFLYKHGNYEAFEKTRDHMEAHGLNIFRDRTIADSAEPKSVADYRSWGADTRGAIKGRGSRDAGYKWLQSLNKIIVDPIRCPHAADEFTLYEYVLDRKTGEILTGYPEGQPDHFLALTRYCTETIWKHAGA
ncbi:MAG: phage terminase large subunit [Clostridia bacterium]|nr:phage terminase large subunit [Clostridia bacterium]